jgi:hypothetical protein
MIFPCLIGGGEALEYPGARGGELELREKGGTIHFVSIPRGPEACSLGVTHPACLQDPP